MGTQIKSWLHYVDVRRESTAWEQRPSGLGYYDIALYILLGRQFARKAKAQKSSIRILDLGTYFGHSAFCFAYGASTISKDSMLDVLSLDIFQQPKWLLSHAPEVVKFLKDFGSTEPESIARCLDAATNRIGLKKNPVRLVKQNVLELSVSNLSEMAPGGFEMIAVDCAKSPELMNRVSEYLTDPRICKKGTVVAFQDLFDWHAPWNVFALSRMLGAGIFSLNYAGPRVTPYAEKISQRDIGVLCDENAVSPLQGEEWCRPFTTLDNEMTELQQFIRLFRARGDTDFACRLECLKVGALLRADRLDTAYDLIVALDQKWPMNVKDSYLQNAYCRYMHLKTGEKDLSLVFDTPGHRARNTTMGRRLRALRTRLSYMRPIRSMKTAPNLIDAVLAERCGMESTG